MNHILFTCFRFYFAVCVQFCLILALLPVCTCLPATVIALLCFTCISLPSVFQPYPFPLVSVRLLWLPLCACALMFCLPPLTDLFVISNLVILPIPCLPEFAACILTSAAYRIKKLVLWTLYLSLFLPAVRGSSALALT